MAPSPNSYDTTTGLSMSSSLVAMQALQHPIHSNQVSRKPSRLEGSMMTLTDMKAGGKSNLVTEESVYEYDRQQNYRAGYGVGRNSKGSGNYMQRTQDMRNSQQTLNQTSQSSFLKMNQLGDGYGMPTHHRKLALAPKIKGGTIA